MQAAGHRLQATGNKLHATSFVLGYGIQATVPYRQQATHKLLHATGYSLQATHKLLQAAGYR